MGVGVDIYGVFLFRDVVGRAIIVAVLYLVGVWLLLFLVDDEFVVVRIFGFFVTYGDLRVGWVCFIGCGVCVWVRGVLSLDFDGYGTCCVWFCSDFDRARIGGEVGVGSVRIAVYVVFDFGDGLAVCGRGGDVKEYLSV